MDDLLPKLLSFPPHPPPKHPLSDQHYDEGIKHQIVTVKKVSEHKLLQQTSGGEDALDVINPALNTVPYTFTLLAHIAALQNNTKGANFEKLWDRITNFLGTYDPRQIRYLGAEFSHIIETTAAMARQSRQPSLAIAPIRDALLRLDPSGMMLTSHHLLLVKLALESRAFNAATPVLEKYILYFPGSSHQPKPKFICDLSLAPTQYITASSGLTSKLKPVEILEYFHYSGMVYIGLRNWEMALECLENAVTYPAKEGAVSKVMAEAYKKWVLVGLLLEGKPLPLPKTTPGNASKQYHILGKPYGTVAQLFESASASRLKAEVEAGTRIWQNDCNTGLMLLVLSAYQKFQIKGLANIYSKISIQEIFNQTMSAETGTKLPHVQAAETLVRGMIQDGSLQATMSNSPNSGSILTFVAGRETLSEARMQQELVASMHRIQELTKEIKQTDRMLTHDKEYIKFAQKQKKNSKMSSGDQAVSMGGPSMDWSGGIEDEDLMGGLY